MDSILIELFVLYFVHVSVVSFERANEWVPISNMDFWCVGGTM